MNGSRLMNNDRLMVFKRFTLDMATLSKCTDKGNACVITDAAGSQVYAIGINGGAKGGPNCLCELDGTKYTCVHAEANALAKSTSTDPDKCVICTQAPCVTCAALMVNNGVKQVYYINKYKSDAGIKILKDAGVHVQDISDEQIKKDWVDHLIDALHACGFISLSSKSVQGRWNQEARDRIIEAGEKLGYVTTVTTQVNGLLVEWHNYEKGGDKPWPK